MTPISRADIDAMIDDALAQAAILSPTRLPYKVVFRGRRRIGLARSWSEVAQLIGDKRHQAGACLSRENVEGPDSFILKEKK